MKFLNPEVVFDGVIQIDGSITADNHAVTKSYLNANSVVGIHADSANYAEVVTVSGEKQLKLKPLTIVDVSVDTSAASQAAWLSANYSNGNEYQEGDVVILTGTGSTRPESYIHNGGSAGTSADWTKIEGADVQASEVRGFLSGSSGIDYNSSTGAITADQAEIRAFFAAGTGLSYSAGTFSLNASTDNVSEGSNLYYTDARARSAISVSGGLLSYNSGTGVLGFSADTDDIAEGSSNLYHTTARARAAISEADGSLCHYDSSTGVIEMTDADVRGALSAGTGLAFSGGQFSFNGDSDVVTEGSSNLYFTDARARGAISVSGSLLSYNSGTGVLGFSADTDDIAEGSTNQYFTNARARSAISEASGSLCFYDPSTGEIDMPEGNIRKEFSSQSLTAGTFATLNHALGKQLVHVTAMDSSNNLVQLEVQFQDANNVKVKANSNITVDIAVSI
jgi:hypothetical protein